MSDLPSAFIIHVSAASLSDPVADGPVIQRASERALKQGTRLEDVLKLAADLRRRRPNAGLIIFSYLNPVLRMGMKKFCVAAEDAGLDGALVTDLPVEEAAEYLREMRERHLAAVFLAAPTSPADRLKSIAKNSQLDMVALRFANWAIARPVKNRLRAGPIRGDPGPPSFCYK